jgi:hypothetical protein
MILTIDVAANARGTRGGLSVLAPHAVSGLGVRKAIWVHNGENVKVVFVLEPGRGGIGRSEELVSSILDDLRYVSMTVGGISTNLNLPLS